MSEPASRPGSAVVLILGGTPEALDLTEAAAGQPGLAPILSLAGRTWAPRQPAGGLVRSGGFGGVDGLEAFLARHRVRALVDATHPYAAGMGWQAAEACERLRLPRLRLERAAWTPQAGDRWLPVDTMAAAADWIGARAENVFLTTGHLGLDQFARCPNAWFLVRAISPPATGIDVPARWSLVLARGPFHRAAEQALMHSREITVLVSKNSGGTGTYGKIEAARALERPVLMLVRPARPDGPVVPGVSEALAWLRRSVAWSGL